MKLVKLPFKSKFLSKPSKKKLTHFLKFNKLRRKPLFITRLVRFFKKPLKKPSPNNKFLSLLRRRPRRSARNKEMDDDRVEGNNKSFSDYAASQHHHHHQRAPFPSPLTPAYIRLSRPHSGRKGEEDGCSDDDVEDACRSFENYLVEMIVEEGKMRDLVDVEDVLHCWNDLTSPVFVDLVCRFYRELCTDLFSSDNVRP